LQLFQVFISSRALEIERTDKSVSADFTPFFQQQPKRSTAVTQKLRHLVADFIGYQKELCTAPNVSA
jgi:hypothetical protein